MTTNPQYQQLPPSHSLSSAPNTQIITTPPQPFFSLPTFKGQGSITDFFDQFESRLNYVGSPSDQRIIHLENHLNDTAAKYWRYLIRNHSRECRGLILFTPSKRNLALLNVLLTL